MTELQFELKQEKTYVAEDKSFGYYSLSSRAAHPQAAAHTSFHGNFHLAQTHSTEHITFPTFNKRKTLLPKKKSFAFHRQNTKSGLGQVSFLSFIHGFFLERREGIQGRAVRKEGYKEVAREEV